MEGSVNSRSVESVKGATARREVGLSRLSLVVSQRQRPQQRKHPEPLRRAVADCLSAGPHATASVFIFEAVRTLEDYLAAPGTIDSAYSALLDHAVAERDRSPPVITKCISLLKKYLFRYIPHDPTLQQIDNFCAGLIAELHAVNGDAYHSRHPILEAALEPPLLHMSGKNNTMMVISGNQISHVASAGLVKSLIYVRSLVARHLPRYSFQTSKYRSSFPVLAKPLSPALSSLRTRSQYAPGGMSQRSMSQDQEAAKAAAMSALGSEGLDLDNKGYIAADVLKWCWLGGKGQQVWAPSPIMMGSGGIARPQVERMENLVEQGAAALFIHGSDRSPSTGQLNGGGKKHCPDFDLEHQLLRISTITTVADAAAARSHQRAIAAAKRTSGHSSTRWDGEASSSTMRGSMSTLRRRPRPLFQYRYYSEQQPLRLSEAEMEEVITAVCTEASGPSSNPASKGPASTQPGKPGVDPANVAASVLIKLLINMYMADSRTAAPLTLYVLQGMLDSSAVAVRIRAFDLVLNLGVHAHLLEPMPSEETAVTGEGGATLPGGPSKNHQEDKEGSGDRPFSSRVPGEATTMKANEKSVGTTPAAVGQFEAWLLDILCEMMFYLRQLEEVDEGVWSSALSCLLYFICERGQIRREKLQGVDIRVLKVMIEVSWENAWDGQIHSRLIRILTNLLYKLPTASEASRLRKPSFDVDQLELLGGIEFICVEYSRATSAEAKRNLFAVIFDFVVYDLINMGNLVGKPVPPMEEIQAVATAFALAEAPECMALAFKQGLPGVGVGLAKLINAAMSRDITSNRLNGMLLEDVAGSLDMLAANYARLDSEFLELLPATMMDGGFNTTPSSSLGFSNEFDFAMASRAWATLHSLLHSQQASYRHNGYCWLLELLLAEMGKEGSKQTSKLNTHVLLRQLERSSSTISPAVRLLCGLLKSRQPNIRRGFIIIVERLLFQCQKAGWDVEILNSSANEGENKQDGGRQSLAQERALALQGLMIGALWQVISAKEKDCINILLMCNMMFSQLCVLRPTPSSGSLDSGSGGTTSFLNINQTVDSSSRQDTFFSTRNEKDQRQQSVNDARRDSLSSRTVDAENTSWASLLLSGQAAVPKPLLANMPTPLLYWPLTELLEAAPEDITLGVAVGSRGGGTPSGGISDVRAALLLLLIGKCTAYPAALDEVGGEQFFRSLLDDMDARIAYYTSAFLLKKMITDEPGNYQRMLHNLVFKAQQSNNEKLLENPYLQLRGILQLSSELGSSFGTSSAFQPET